MTAEGPGKSKIQYGYTRCPACHTDLNGGMIPMERRGLYDGAERYSKVAVWNNHLACPSCAKELGPRTSSGNSKQGVNLD